MSKTTELFNGFQDSLRFSNWPVLITQRLFCRDLPIVVYQWKRQWIIECDDRFGDLNSPKELLARAAYNPYILKSIRNGNLDYVNVGANIGVFDIAVASLDAISKRAVAMELNPVTYARFLHNLRINRLNGIIALNYGIAKASGTVRIPRTRCAYSDSIFSISESGHDADTIECRLLSLEEALEKAGAAHVDFQLLKLDCEGAEYEIVEHTPDSCLSRFENIVMELHPAPKGASQDRLFAKLKEAGFECRMAGHTPDENGLLFWTRNPLGSK